MRAIGRGPVRPPALARSGTVGQAPNRVGVLLVLLVEEGSGGHIAFEAVGLQLLDRGQPHVLVGGVAGQVELEHLLHARVVGHVVQPRRLQAALGLGGDVGAEVGQQVPAGDDELAIPPCADRVREHRAPAIHDGLLRVHAAHDRRHGRILDGVCGDVVGGALQQAGDHGGEHLDVADLLGGYVHDEVLVLALYAAVPALEQVLHGHGHLAVGAAESSWSFLA